jgi:hypothetical protein
MPEVKHRSLYLSDRRVFFFVVFTHCINQKSVQQKLREGPYQNSAGSTLESAPIGQMHLAMARVWRMRRMHESQVVAARNDNSRDRIRKTDPHDQRMKEHC